jgi:hypothetical protein
MTATPTANSQIFGFDSPTTTSIWTSSAAAIWSGDSVDLAARSRQGSWPGSTKTMSATTTQRSIYNSRSADIG